MDSSADRNHILEDFQACTNIEDIGYAIQILEEYDWNLLEAINSVIPQHQDPLIDVDAVPSDSRDPDLEVRGTAAVIDITGECSNSRTVFFTVMYNTESARLSLPDSATVGSIKRRLSEKLCVPSFKMCLVWEDSQFSSTDSMTLRELHLPMENTLHLIVLPSLVSEPLAGDSFLLRITYKETGKAYNISLPGAVKISEVKAGLADVVHLPVDRQLWSGWPVMIHDDLPLSECNLSRPLHILEVCNTGHQSAADRLRDSNLPATVSQPVRNAQRVEDEPIVIDDDGNNSEDQDVYHSLDDDDDSFSAVVPNTSSKTGIQPLLPPVILDYDAAAGHFNTEFTRRYGPCRPDFFVGGLEDAVRHSLLVPARERRPLIIYLHHDRSVSANIFCSQVLCAETVVNYLMTNFLIWAWDLTLPSNKDRLVSQANTALGSLAGETVQRLHYDQLPLLLIMSKSRSNLEIRARHDATASVEELMNGLMLAVEDFQQQQQQDIIEQDERDAREMEKYQQDTAYAVSLAADRAKVRAEEMKKKEEVERQLKEMEARKQEEDKDARKQATLQSMAAELTGEPDASAPAGSVSTLRVRCPDGTVLHRRFLATDRLTALHSFLAYKGYLPADYRLLVVYPKRELGASDASRSLLDLQLHPQETLILEARI